VRTGGGLDKFATVTGHSRNSLPAPPHSPQPCQTVPELKPDVGPMVQSGAQPSEAAAKDRVSKKQLDESAHQKMLETLHQPDAPWAGARPLSRQPSHRVPKPDLAGGERPHRGNKYLLVTAKHNSDSDYVPSDLIRKPVIEDPKPKGWPAARAVDDPDAVILRTGGIHKHYTADKATLTPTPTTLLPSLTYPSLCLALSLCLAGFPLPSPSRVTILPRGPFISPPQSPAKGTIPSITSRDGHAATRSARTLDQNAQELGRAALDGNDVQR